MFRLIHFYYKVHIITLIIQCFFPFFSYLLPSSHHCTSMNNNDTDKYMSTIENNILGNIDVFLEILKQTLENFKKINTKCFLWYILRFSYNSVPSNRHFKRTMRFLCCFSWIFCMIWLHHWWCIRIFSFDGHISQKI